MQHAKRVTKVQNSMHSGGNTTLNRMEPVDDLSDGKAIKPQEFVWNCDEINKRSMGRAILQFCGNEGTEDDDNKATLRRLMQAVISHIDKEKSETWKNAEVKIYDENFDVYSVRAGNGRKLFIATFDGLENPQVIKTSRSKSESELVQRGHCSTM